MLPEATPVPPATLLERLRWLLTEDHCEWANRYVYWLRSPLGILGVGAIASLLFGVFAAPQGFILLAAIAAVVATGLVWPKLGIAGVSCEVEFAGHRAREGQPTPVTVRLVNRWPWPAWGLVIEDGFFDVGPGEDGAAVGLARIGGWSRTTFQWNFTPLQRGRYPRATPALTTAFPFGLWKASKPVEVTGSIVAWPETFWLPPFPITAGTRAWRGDPCDAYAGSDGERIGVREHRQGDALRLVHWAKTACYDRLIVSERQGAASCSATVTVDTDPQHHAGVGADSSLEWSLRIAGSVAATLIAQDVHLELQLGGERRCFGASRPDFALLMDWLAEYGAEGQARSGGEAGARRAAEDAVRLRITTDRLPPQPGELAIVLDADSFGGVRAQTHSTPPTVASWIAVGGPEDVAASVLSGWRRAAGEAGRGA
ncbi:MAG: DUF58 domain-containing protein [Planctomycetota bacterium]